ncbi:MAG: N-acetylmuramoyl-L-alanine amidase [Terriglobales bacterium]
MKRAGAPLAPVDASSFRFSFTKAIPPATTRFCYEHRRTVIFQHKTQLHRYLLLLCVIMAGCSRQHRAKVTVPQPPVVAQKREAPPPQSAVIARLRESGNILLQLIADSNNAVSDAILNRTLCFAAFPDGANANASGFVTCRNSIGDWISPAVGTLSNSSQTQVQGALLLFIVNDRVRQTLVHGLDVGVRITAGPGPSTRDRATLDQVELSRDAFAYVRTGNSLRGVGLDDAALKLDAAETGRLYGHPQDPQSLLSGSTMSSTVTSGYVLDVGSFFNTITPAGIIVHHSVLVATKNRQAEGAIDTFHYSHGLEISCFGKTYHIAYHYLILPNGEVRAGRPERCEGAHARGYNSYLGIALVGDFSSADNPRGRKGPMRPTKAQMASLVRLCRQLREKYNIPLQHIMPHSDVSRTECPGDRLQFTQLLLALQQTSAAGS